MLCVVAVIAAVIVAIIVADAVIKTKQGTNADIDIHARYRSARAHVSDHMFACFRIYMFVKALRFITESKTKR